MREKYFHVKIESAHIHGHVPEEVVPAEELRFPGEALVL